MNRQQRRAARLLPTSLSIASEPEHYRVQSDNGLLEINVVYGLTRPPGSAAEVKIAFADLVAKLREFADTLEKVNERPYVEQRGGDA